MQSSAEGTLSGDEDLRDDTPGRLDRVGQIVARSAASDESPQAAVERLIALGTERMLRQERVGVLPPLRAAMWIARELDDEAALGRALFIAAQHVNAHGRRYVHAVSLFARTAARFRAAGNERAACSADAMAAYPLTLLGRLDEADRILRRVVEFARGAGDTNEEATALTRLAMVAMHRGRTREAARQFRAARRLDDTPDVVGAMNLGRLMQRCARHGAALHWCDTAERLLIESQSTRPRPTAHAMLRANRAYSLATLGRLRQAWKEFDAAEAAFADLGLPRHVAQCHVDRAEFEVAAGHFRDAAARLRQAAETLRRAGVVHDEARALVSTAAALLHDRRSGEATDVLRRAGELFDRTKNARGLIDVGLLLAAARSMEGDHDSAWDIANDALERALRTDSPRRAAAAELMRARLALRRAHPARALDIVRTARRRVPARARTPWLEIAMLRAAADASEALGMGREADAARHRAVALIESSRGMLPTGAFTASYLASIADVYGPLIERRVDAGAVDEAFALVESSRSRVLVDMLGTAPVSRSAHGRAATLRQRAMRLRLLLRRDPDAPGDESGDERAERVQPVEVELERVYASLWQTDPRLASLTSVGVSPPDDVRRALGDDTTLVEYHVAGDRVHAFVVDVRGTRVVSTAVSHSVLQQIVDRFELHLRLAQSAREPADRAKASVAATRANLADAYELLLAPVEHLLDRPRLVISPHGVLRRLPFHALPREDAWTCDRWDVWYAPSATAYVLAATRRTAAPGRPSVFALGDHNARGIERSAHDLGPKMGEAVRDHSGKQATLARLSARARDSRVLHVAAHGTHRSDRPSHSAIWFHDGPVTAHDVYGLDVRSELVTLAACHAGAEPDAAHAEFMGFPHAFLFAGAHRVLAGRWRIDDASTVSFMGVFYAEARRLGSWEAGCREAMARVRDSQPHPYHWAAFFLHGHPRPRIEARAPATNGPNGAVRGRTG